MSGGFKSFLAGVLGRFAAPNTTPPVTDIPDTDWYSAPTIGIWQSNNRNAVNASIRPLSVWLSDVSDGIWQSDNRNAAYVNTCTLAVWFREPFIGVCLSDNRNGIVST